MVIVVTVNVGSRVTNCISFLVGFNTCSLLEF